MLLLYLRIYGKLFLEINKIIYLIFFKDRKEICFRFYSKELVEVLKFVGKFFRL